MIDKRSMSLTLVILAAGKGSRFGGDKPLAAVGPSGQSLFEYSVHDAVQAGFQHVILVVNEQQDTSGFSQRFQRYGDKLKVEFVVQSLTAQVEPEMANLAKLGRSKPWGTAHAVLACREKIRNPFIVINADDYYGRKNFQSIGHYLLENSRNPQACALPGYKLKNTLSRSGGVNRGICLVDPDGYLESICEVRNIVPAQLLSLSADQMGDHISISNESIVSMTFWGFHPSMFNILKSEFDSFLDETTDLVNDEFYIPAAVDKAIKSGLLKARVFPTSEKWRGLTFAGDMDEVREFISTLVKSGKYPDLEKH